MGVKHQAVDVSPRLETSGSYIKALKKDIQVKAIRDQEPTDNRNSRDYPDKADFKH